MSSLYLCPLFEGLSPAAVDSILAQGHVRHYAKGQWVATQGDAYNALLLVAYGKLRGEMVNHQGEQVVIEEIPAPRAVAPAILYASNNSLPVDIVAVDNTHLVAIDRTKFTTMMQEYPQLLINFMRSVADRSRFLADRLRLMRFGTIRSKLATYLLEVMGQHQVGLSFTIVHTQQELADMFGVTRPALSRTLAQLVDQGIIGVQRKQVVVHQVHELEKIATLKP